MTTKIRSQDDIVFVRNELDLKIKVAIAANDFVLYQKYSSMRAALSWVLGHSEPSLDALKEGVQ